MPIPPDAFFLDHAAGLPLQVQLRRQIIAAVTAGRFRAGEKLPSTRALARHLGVARVTVAQAFAELVSTDYLASRDRSGHYISDSIERRLEAEAPAPATPRFDWDSQIEGRFARAQRTDRERDWRRFAYPFVYGQADPALVDHAAWRDCAMRALGRREFDSLTGDLYDADDPELVDHIARQILPRRGISAGRDEILLTMGAQNALWLVAQVLLRPGASCAVEDPSYPGQREILLASRARILPVPVDARGLPPDAIPPGVAAVFTTASHQCPTNSTMPLARRKELLARAQAQGFAVVEDDYEFEMSFAGAPSPALKAIDRAGAVIYIGSFSKSVFPGVRLGYVVADPRVIAEARALRGMVLRHPPGHMQRTLAHFLSLGHYDAQANRMRRAYARRREVMLAAIAREGLRLASPEATGGSSFWLATPEGVDSSALALRLKARGVLIEGGAAFFAQPARGRGFFRLAYSSISAERIPEGIRRIAEALQEQDQGAPPPES
ncbi:PLP-dependent aminotransferase family protein [Paracoccus versutus]|uniref:GntR family transcriptional regulator n=1 Tax=Paracoccus versutus TaxID=34007 RepID=A0AAQ0HHX4_PARVE|nr:PLP-dependent aminotransferase family protein [Paracoccus versutus]KGJ09804.1 GntR family transcriptional regulator [Paracoccus versutus]REG47723.1 GntR family transcriptional regulator [Paracoccus versutus]WEJ79760.1 PLP-dependent aminotransferase family protein [Paracoccus versutus]